MYYYVPSEIPGKTIVQTISNWLTGNSAQGSSKQVTMATRIEALLFPAGEQKIATEDSAIFAFVMSEFFHYEEEVNH